MDQNQAEQIKNHFNVLVKGLKTSDQIGTIVTFSVELIAMGYPKEVILRITEDFTSKLSELGTGLNPNPTESEIAQVDVDLDAIFENLIVNLREL